MSLYFSYLLLKTIYRGCYEQQLHVGTKVLSNKLQHIVALMDKW